MKKRALVNVSQLVIYVKKKSFRFADFYDINSSLHGLFQAASVIVLKEKLGRCVHRKALSQNEPAHQCI